MSGSDNYLSGECVLDSCPEHLVPVAVRTALHCLKKPSAILRGESGLTVFPSDRTLLRQAEESLDDAIAKLLARSEGGQVDEEQPRDSQDPFTLAVLWGTLMGIAFADDIAGGISRGKAEAILARRIGA